MASLQVGEQLNAVMWYVMIGPSAVFALGTLLGVVRPGPHPLPEHPKLAWFCRALNFVLASLLCHLLPFLLVVMARWHPKVDDVLPKKEQKYRVIFVLLGIFLVRFVLYLPFHLHRGWNWYFSDHIFLLCSLIAQIQVVLYVYHCISALSESHRERRFHRVVIGVSWGFVLAFTFEAYNTAAYFHTRQATVCALLLGTGMFTGCAMWFMRRIRAIGNNDYEALPEK